ncbi:MAG: hypothetical protein WC969_07580 [Elusimicrobiota bacterium]
MVIRSICAAVLAGLLASAVRAEAPAVAFDQGVDVQQILSVAKEKAGEDKVQVEKIDAAYIRATRECANLVFEPNGPSMSPTAWLSSTEYIQECYNPNPPHSGPICHERPGFTYNRQVRVEILDRQALLPWEREVVEVCLERNWLSTYVLAGAHEYKIRELGDLVQLVPGRRIAMDPDAAGLRAEAPVNRGAAVAASFTDLWASYYPGEKTSIKVKLRREVPGWFDSTLVEKEVSFPTAERYTVDFNDFLADMTAKLEVGQTYYVEWGFRRLGQVSKDTYIKRGDTDRVTFMPTLAAAAW